MDRTGERKKVGLVEVLEIGERYGRREGWREKAIQAWRSHIRVFARFLEEEGVDDFKEVDRARMQGFQAWLPSARQVRSDAPYALKSQCAYLCAAKQAYAALDEEGLLLADHTMVLRYPKLPRHIPRVLEQPEVRRVLDAADLETVLGYRDRAMMELLYTTLIRASEIGGLLSSDVQEEDRRLFIRGKGGRERIVPVGRIAWGYLVEYREGVRPFLSPRSDHVFLGRKTGQGLSTSRVSSIVGEYVARAGFEMDAGAHLLRYSGATHMIENGADIRQVQELLGHVSIGSTMGYCLTSAMALKIAHAKAHPREKEKGGKAR